MRNLEREQLINKFKNLKWKVQEDGPVPSAISPNGGIRVSFFHEKIQVRIQLTYQCNSAEFLTKIIDTLPLVVPSDNG